MTRFLDKLNEQIHETELQLEAHLEGLHIAKRNGNPDDLLFYESEVYALGYRLNALQEAKEMFLDDPEDDFIFNVPSDIYREPDETSAVAFDGNVLPF